VQGVRPRTWWQAEKAKKCILKGIYILEELKIAAYLSIGYLYLGKLYADLDQKKQALKNFEKGEEMFREMSSDFWLAVTFSAYADLSEREGDLSKAKEHLHNAIGIFNKLSADGWVEKYEKALAELG